MIKLDWNNRTIYKIPKKKIEKLLLIAQKFLGRPKNDIISFAFISTAAIRKLNKTYRGKDKVTDVLSFEDHDADLLGEILICPWRAKKQARIYEQSFAAEVLKLSLHGYLHLLGFDHERDSDAIKMESIEEKILKKKLS